MLQITAHQALWKPFYRETERERKGEAGMKKKGEQI
jgi:hypothetical protein